MQVEKEFYVFGTVSRSEQIAEEIEIIRNLWQKGYNLKTKEIYQIEPLIEGLELLDRFIKRYWSDISADEKLRLITQAGYLESLNNFDSSSGLKAFFSAILSGRLWMIIKLSFKYR